MVLGIFIITINHFFQVFVVFWHINKPSYTMELSYHIMFFITSSFTSPSFWTLILGINFSLHSSLLMLSPPGKSYAIPRQNNFQNLSPPTPPPHPTCHNKSPFKSYSIFLFVTKKKLDRLCMKFSSTPILVCRCTSIPYFKINTPFFLLPLLCQRISQPQGKNQKMVNQ